MNPGSYLHGCRHTSAKKQLRRWSSQPVIPPPLHSMMCALFSSFQLSLKFMLISLLPSCPCLGIVFDLKPLQLGFCSTSISHTGLYMLSVFIHVLCKNTAYVMPNMSSPWPFTQFGEQLRVNQISVSALRKEAYICLFSNPSHQLSFTLQNTTSYSLLSMLAKPFNTCTLRCKPPLYSSLVFSLWSTLTAVGYFVFNSSLTA